MLTPKHVCSADRDSVIDVFMTESSSSCLHGLQTVPEILAVANTSIGTYPGLSEVRFLSRNSANYAGEKSPVTMREM
jgi:hypothetical protein